MRRFDTVNVAAGGCLALVGAVYLYLAGEYPAGSPGSPGPGMLPVLVGSAEVLAGLVIVVLAFLGRFAALLPAEVPDPDARVIAVREAWLAAMLVVYAILLPTLGFVIATAGLVAGFTARGGGTRWPAVLTVSVALSVALYGLFTVLGVKFPPGIFFDATRS